MNQVDLKTKYGWNKDFEAFFLSNLQNPQSHKGTFKIKKHSNGWFWYFRLARSGKDRDIYLCSVEPKGKNPGQTSFQHCCQILLKKIDSNFSIGSTHQKFLHSYIDKYFDFLNEERKSLGGRKPKTLRDMQVSLRDFQTFCRHKKILLEVVPVHFP
ncbi:MAG: hypothetical protein IPN26_02320 [Bacteroidetes bacterium]|nr:hypothetical protein [Bacteroidota bacterium]